MGCLNCPHWQGTRFSEYGDCYRVIAKLCPELCEQVREWEDTQIPFTVPFDPHDIQYWSDYKFMRALYQKALSKARTIDGIRVDNRKAYLWFYQTHKDFDCEVLNES